MSDIEANLQLDVEETPDVSRLIRVPTRCCRCHGSASDVLSSVSCSPSWIKPEKTDD